MLKQTFLSWYKQLAEFIFEVEKIFSSRELAIGLWLVIAIIYVFINNKIRTPFVHLLKSAFCLKFVIIYILMSMYTIVIVQTLSILGFWNESLLKDTILWFIFTSVFSAFKAVGKAKDFSYFKSLLKEYITIAIILEFIINNYTFSLIGEFILIPIICTITMVSVLLSNSQEFRDDKYHLTKKVVNYIIIALALFIIFHSLLLIISDIDNFVSVSNLKSLCLPPLLSLLFIGFIYCFILWTSYEEIFVRLRCGEKKSDSLILYIKFRIILLCNINIEKVNYFWKVSRQKLFNIKSHTDISEIIEDFKQIANKNI